VFPTFQKEKTLAQYITALKKKAMKVTGIHFKNSTQQTVPAKNSMC